MRLPWNRSKKDSWFLPGETCEGTPDRRNILRRQRGPFFQ